MRRLLDRLCCWWGWHSWGEPWLAPSEHEELHEDAAFVTCRRCGVDWRVI